MSNDNPATNARFNQTRSIASAKPAAHSSDAAPHLKRIDVAEAAAQNTNLPESSGYNVESEADESGRDVRKFAPVANC